MQAFATGVRIEHPQSMVNLSQYGKESVEGLGAAAYKLTINLPLRQRRLPSACARAAMWSMPHQKRGGSQSTV